MQPSINQMSEKFHCYVCPNFCVLKFRVCLNEANPSLEFSIRVNWSGTDLFREHWDHSLVFQDSMKFLEGLIMHSYSKCLPHPSRWIAGLSVWKLLSFGNSWEKCKIFLPFFLRYFDWNHAFYYVNKFSVLKMNFLLNIDTYFYPSL